MKILSSLLHQAFPLMAVAGLLAAAWTLSITPDEMRVGSGKSLAWSYKYASEAFP